MGTTSLKLDAALRRRVQRLAKTEGVTPHALMVDAIRSRADQLERRQRFLDEADASDAEMEASGEGFRHEDVASWAKALARGEKARRPRSTRWR